MANTVSLYDADVHCNLVIELGKTGASFAAFRAQVGLTSSTFYKWRENHPEFDEACSVADAWSTLWWEELGQKVAASGKGSAPMILAALYNRAGGDWRNKQEVVQHNINSDALDVSKLTDEELEAYQKILAAKERMTRA